MVEDVDAGEVVAVLDLGFSSITTGVVPGHGQLGGLTIG